MATHGSSTLDCRGLINRPTIACTCFFARQTAFMLAPSMATPARTYFHRATSSLRARATIVVLRRVLTAVRSRNHLLSADSGWLRSHNHASWIIFTRRRGLPALDTPCSRSIEPLFQGVGARPE